MPRLKKVPVNDQGLIFVGKELEGGHTLQDSTLHLILTNYSNKTTTVEASCVVTILETVSLGNDVEIKVEDVLIPAGS